MSNAIHHPLQKTFTREWTTIRSRVEGARILNKISSDRITWYNLEFVDPNTFDSMVAFSIISHGNPMAASRYFAIRRRDINISPPFTSNKVFPGRASLSDTYPGPWTVKTRVQQLISDRDAGNDWYTINETVVDADGKRIPEEKFDIGSGLAGKAGWLGLTDYDLERVQYVKRYK